MRTKRLLAYSAIYFLWGGSYVAIRCVVAVIPPLLAAGIRYTLAGLILLAISSAAHRVPLPPLVQLRNAAFTGIMSLGVAFGAVFWAETRLPSWIIGVLLTTSFLWTYLGECLLDRRRPEPKTLAAILVGLAAVPLIVKPVFHHLQGSAPAVVVALAAAWIWSASVLVIRSVALPSASLQRAALQLISAGPLLILVAFLTGQTRSLEHIADAVTWQTVLSMAYLIFAASLLAFSAFQWLIKHEKPHLVATFSYVNPVVALLAGMCLLGERCTPAQIAGASILLLSIYAVWYFDTSSTRIPLPLGADTTQSHRRADLEETGATAAL